MEKILNTITHGDSFKLIDKVEDNSVDLILTDPPYFINAEKGFKGKDWDSSKNLLSGDLIYKIENKILNGVQAKKEYLRAVEEYFIKVTETLFLPKTKEDGVLIVFNRKNNLDTVKLVLDQDTFTNQEWKNTPLSKEQKEPNSRWFTTVLEWKKSNPNKTITEHAWSEYALIAINTTNSNVEKISQIPRHWDDSLNFNNQYYASSPHKSLSIFGGIANHVTPKPIQVWADLIKRFSKPNHLVFDPFSGSGTTAMVAEDLHRQYIAFEFDEEQVARSLERLNNFKESMPHSLFLFED